MQINDAESFGKSSAKLMLFVYARTGAEKKTATLT